MLLQLLIPLLLFFTLTARAAPAQEGANLATPDPVTLAMLRIADVRAGDFVLDLGSGNGAVVIIAARRFGARGLGVEQNSEMVDRSRANAQAAGVAGKVAFQQQNPLRVDLSPATVVTLHLQQDATLALRPRLLELRPGTRIVSHTADLGDWRPDRRIAVSVQPKGGSRKVSPVYLWRVPAQLAGTWCAVGRGSGTRLEIRQMFQEVEGKLLHAGRAFSFSGSLSGTALLARQAGGSRLELDAEDGGLTVRRVQGLLQHLKGGRFERAGSSGCAHDS